MVFPVLGEMEVQLALLSVELAFDPAAGVLLVVLLVCSFGPFPSDSGLLVADLILEELALDLALVGVGEGSSAVLHAGLPLADVFPSVGVDLGAAAAPEPIFEGSFVPRGDFQGLRIDLDLLTVLVARLPILPPAIGDIAISMKAPTPAVAPPLAKLELPIKVFAVVKDLFTGPGHVLVPEASEGALAIKSDVRAGSAVVLLLDVGEADVAHHLRWVLINLVRDFRHHGLSWEEVVLALLPLRVQRAMLRKQLISPLLQRHLSRPLLLPLEARLYLRRGIVNFLLILVILPFVSLGFISHLSADLRLHRKFILLKEVDSELLGVLARFVSALLATIVTHVVVRDSKYC